MRHIHKNDVSGHLMYTGHSMRLSELVDLALRGHAVPQRSAIPSHPETGLSPGPCTFQENICKCVGISSLKDDGAPFVIRQRAFRQGAAESGSEPNSTSISR